MCELLGLSDTELLQSCVAYDLTHGVLYVLFWEEDVQALERRIVWSHAVVLEVRNGRHTILRHVLLGKHDGELFRAVVAVVEEDHYIALLDGSHWLAITNMYDRFDKLVGYAFCITLFYSLEHVFCCFSLALNDTVVSDFHALPTFVAVHGVEATLDRSDLAAAGSQVLLELVDETKT